MTAPAGAADSASCNVAKGRSRDPSPAGPADALTKTSVISKPGVAGGRGAARSHVVPATERTSKSRARRRAPPLIDQVWVHLRVPANQGETPAIAVARALLARRRERQRRPPLRRVRFASSMAAEQLLDRNRGERRGPPDQVTRTCEVQVLAVEDGDENALEPRRPGADRLQMVDEPRQDLRREAREGGRGVQDHFVGARKRRAFVVPQPA